MAEPGSESPAPTSSGAGFQRRVAAVRTPEGKVYPEAARPPPAIPDHELLRCIGRGSYGEVWLGRNVLGDYRAVKIIDRLHFDSDHAYEREFEGLKRYEPVSLGDPSQVAVLYVGRNDSAGFYYYVMELADAAKPQASDQCSVISDQSLRSAVSATARMPISPDHGSLITSYAPRTLKSELARHRRLPLDECVDIGLALTTALDHLHRHGLIHRDIKPSNVIFVHGVPKLADIGLVARIDATLSFVGTEGYIPPEGPGTPQADLYSLGKVLYEISSGKDRTAFPEPLTLLGEERDKARLLELNAVIHKACQNDPRQRYLSAEAMHRDLQVLKRGESVRRRQLVQRRQVVGGRLTMATLAAAALAFAVYWTYKNLLSPQEMVPASVEHPVAVPLKASVFVLPFRGAGTNEISDDLCSRVTDAFIDSLALIEGVRRSPRKSGWRYLDEDEVRHALVKTNELRHILKGRVSGSNDRLTISLGLYQRQQEQPLWAESFSAKTNELIALEEQTLHKLAQRLGLKLSANEEQRIGLRLTNNLEAFRIYEQAQTVYARKGGTQNGFKEVRELCQKAMDLDHRYLDADVFDAYMLRNLARDRAPSDVWPDVRRRMASVLEQDDTCGGGLEHLTGYTLCYLRDWDGAYAIWTRELFYTSKQWGCFVGALWCRYYGWFDEARVYQKEFEHPEPTNPDQRWGMASCRWVERRYAEGARVAQRTVEMYPGNAEGYQWLAHCLVAKGDYPEGIQAALKAQEVWKNQEMTALRGVACAKMGQPEKARDVLQELLEIQHTGPYLQPYFVARVYSALNEKDKALEWLEKAEQDRSEYLLLGDFGGGLRTDPAWDDFQDDPRFKALLKKVGLDQWPRPKPKRPLLQK